MLEDGSVISAIIEERKTHSPQRALLVGISGIDASGKGFITQKLSERLRKDGRNAAVISADDWLNLPKVCMNSKNYAEHFYEHAIRFDEMFEQLIIPLKRNRHISLTADCADAKATAFRNERYDFRNIDVVLLEGIFLFKPPYRHHFDLSVWIDCSFEAALARAIERGQEGLPPAETRRAFETIYFPAQRVHLARDNPRTFADLVLDNNSQTNR
jgi:uridine kinase